MDISQACVLLLKMSACMLELPFLGRVAENKICFIVCKDNVVWFCLY